MYVFTQIPISTVLFAVSQSQCVVQNRTHHEVASTLCTPYGSSTEALTALFLQSI